MASGSFGFIRRAGAVLALASVASGTKPTLRGRPSMPTAQLPMDPYGQFGMPNQLLGSSMAQPWAPSDPKIEVGCGTASDFDTAVPISQVRQNNKDGFCHFAARAPWLKGCSAARRDRDYATYAKNMGGFYQAQLSGGLSKSFSGPPSPTGFFYGGGSKRIYTQLNLWPLEDAYCVANGWVSMPNNIIMNSTKLEEVSSLECKALMLEHPEFQRTSMKELLFLAEQNNEQLLVSQAGFSPGPTIADLKHHAIARCLLGGLECDIANCAMNFCHRDDLGFNFIGHSFLQCGGTKLQE